MLGSVREPGVEQRPDTRNRTGESFDMSVCMVGCACSARAICSLAPHAQTQSPRTICAACSTLQPSHSPQTLVLCTRPLSSISPEPFGVDTRFIRVRGRCPGQRRRRLLTHCAHGIAHLCRPNAGTVYLRYVWTAFLRFKCVQECSLCSPSASNVRV